MCSAPRGRQLCPAAEEVSHSESGPEHPDCSKVVFQECAKCQWASVNQRAKRDSPLCSFHMELSFFYSLLSFFFLLSFISPL